MKNWTTEQKIKNGDWYPNRLCYHCQTNLLIFDKNEPSKTGVCGDFVAYCHKCGNTCTHIAETMIDPCKLADKWQTEKFNNAIRKAVRK